MKGQRVLFSSMFNVWNTPKALYEDLDREFHFDFDPCPEDPKINGIFCDWGKSNFINPPYNKAINGWLDKARIELEKGNISVFLLPARTDTRWFHEIVLPFASEIRFIRGRVKFELQGSANENTGAPFPSMIVIFRPR